MQKTSKISAHIDEFLNIAKIEDSSYNGLQVEGKDEIKKIAFAVDAGAEVFEKAVAANADMLVVHHGLFWDRTDPRLIGANKKRIDILLSANINLYAAHLPLDMNDEVGNNVELIRIAGATPSGKFYKYRSDFIGAIGKFDAPQSVSKIAENLEKTLSTKTHILGENRKVSTVAAVSGGVGQETVNFAKEAGADLLIVGEKRDFYHTANDLGVSVIFAGHHASEQVGIWALQKHIQEKFPDIDCVYIDCPTGL
ncbi:MAG: Nif3-like dinuclear metal center hexameric protein [Chitinivibrionia bacterium]|nr:Nif3-like dinuclear metal center hexameric protein [Chitinivibrionia bacterium]